MLGSRADRGGGLVSDFYVETERTARIEHLCEEHRPRGCRRTSRILPGTRYVVCAGRHDGDMFSVKVCMRCSRAYKRLHERFGPLDEDDGPPFGDLVGWLRSAHHYGYETRKQREAREELYRQKTAELEARRIARSHVVQEASP